mmetsp:Transcript_20872/g.39831  ORF Transcript_20872/g.39831 Transcript_20872/m.39831 type:complete len:395 (-) Transcript_20872:72-1256(-)
MPAQAEVVLLNSLFPGIEVPDKCTVGQWKQLLAQGSLLGDKILYTAKLAISSLAAKGEPLADNSNLPTKPEKVLVSGPSAVVTILQGALRKKVGEPQATDIVKKLEAETNPVPVRNGRSPSSQESLKHSGKDDIISFYANALTGLREAQEDRTMSVMELPDYDSASLFGIFDGHGGSEVSEFVSRIMPGIVSQALQKVKPKTALTASFAEIDRQVKRHVRKVGLVGTTAVVCLILREAQGKVRVYVAHVGDSRAVLCSNKTAVQITEDHKPADNEKEAERIKNAGGMIDNRGRIDGGLNVSRAFGDFGYKIDSNLKPADQKVIAIPEITEVKLKKGDEFLFMASDGVFDAFENQEVVDILKKGTNMEAAVNNLLDEATISNDNVSGCLIRLPQK